MTTRALRAERVQRSEQARGGLAAGARTERMRRCFADFFRSAWDVIEPGTPLEWNWHLEAICDHLQIEIEEWRLAGMKPAVVEETLRSWVQLRSGRMRGYAEVMLAHWNRPRDEGGCGRGVYRQRAQNLVLNACPISLKSRIAMVYLPAWVWLETPNWQVLCSSGTPSNVDRDSLLCRDLVTSDWYRETFGIRWQATEIELEIRDDLDRVAKWGTTSGGIREARGTKSSFTGIHVDAILFDDPDDSAKVWSDAARRETWLAWLAMGNRANDLKRIVRIVLQQNVHPEDLSNKLIGQAWARLAIPLEFDPKRRAELYSAPFGWRDPRNAANDNMQPSRFTPEVIAAERVRLGSHGFEAQYNCNAAPLDGGMIKRPFLRFFRIEGDPLGEFPRPRPPGCVGSGAELGTLEQHPAFVLKRLSNGALDLDWMTLTVDATFGSLDPKTASNVGLIVAGGKAQRRFVLDDKTEAMTFGQTKAAIRKLISTYFIRRVLIELKANGQSIIDDLTEELAKGVIVERDGVITREPLRWPDGTPAVVVLEAVTDVRDSKEARAVTMVPEYEAGLVLLLDGAHWLDAHVGEICVFPLGKKNDRVDAMSQLMTRYRIRPETKKTSLHGGEGGFV